MKPKIFSDYLYYAMRIYILGFCWHASTFASIIINEFDYDQPGTDTAEFIELYNTGDIPISLNGYTLQLINGSTGTSYNEIDLSAFAIAANDYFVLCDSTDNVANCDMDVGSNNWMQNGGSDGEAIALFNGNERMDSVAYEYNNELTLGLFAEGNTGTLADSNSIVVSLARIPNGLDTQVNETDFSLSCLTPGSANIAGTGDCSSLNLSEVPVPAAVWLFGSGLVSLLGIGRIRQSGASGNNR